jgi:hypothetical protein
MNVKEMDTLRLVRDQAIEIQKLREEIEEKQRFVELLMESNRRLKAGNNEDIPSETL